MNAFTNWGIEEKRSRESSHLLHSSRRRSSTGARLGGPRTRFRQWQDMAGQSNVQTLSPPPPVESKRKGMPYSALRIGVGAHIPWRNVFDSDMAQGRARCVNSAPSRGQHVKSSLHWCKASRPKHARRPRHGSPTCGSLPVGIQRPALICSADYHTKDSHVQRMELEWAQRIKIRLWPDEAGDAVLPRSGRSRTAGQQRPAVVVCLTSLHAVELCLFFLAFEEACTWHGDGGCWRCSVREGSFGSKVRLPAGPDRRLVVMVMVIVLVLVLVLGI